MLRTDTDIISVSSKELSTIVKDVVKSANAVDLVYVRDNEPGIQRIKKGKGFSYLYKSKKITKKSELERFKKLVIPPAWKSVWICTLDNGHLQATGIDQKNRKQYKYHTLWNALRNHTKFYRLYEFGKTLPQIRIRIEQDLNLPGMPPEKVLALVVSLMERTNIRVGNNIYEKLYGSYGLTTLKDKHVTFSSNKVHFKFVGKKGISHSISLNNKKLATLVKKCKDIPGKELFQYEDEGGNYRSIDSGMVNTYIKEISGSDFSAKDFRTWSGTIHALLALKMLGYCETKTETKNKISEALEMVSVQLGNTRNVCKKYYVHPAIISLYENNQLERYFKALDKIEENDNKADLTCEEKVLMRIFEKETLNLKK